MAQVWIALFIFTARLVDVSIGTVRLILLSRGLRGAAAILGFFEILVWLSAMGLIIKNLNNPLNFVAFAAGFAVGNYVGVTLERALSIGNVIIRIITKKDASELVQTLRERHYSLTVVDAQGAEGPVKIIFTVAKRKSVKEVVECVQRFNPNAFYTIEDIRYVSVGEAGHKSATGNLISRMSLAFKVR